jgi:hypothetical protein
VSLLGVVGPRAIRLAVAFHFAATVSAAQESAPETETTNDRVAALAPTKSERATPAENPALPPVPVEQMAAKAPQPSWDTGLLLGMCGVGNEQVWQVTKFCLGGVVDLMFLRERENETGIGGYFGVPSPS